MPLHRPPHSRWIGGPSRCRSDSEPGMERRFGGSGVLGFRKQFLGGSGVGVLALLPRSGGVGPFHSHKKRKLIKLSMGPVLRRKLTVWNKLTTCRPASTRRSAEPSSIGPSTTVVRLGVGSSRGRGRGSGALRCHRQCHRQQRTGSHSRVSQAAGALIGYLILKD
ncbi:hypothetical protein T310_6222 [Rasamsonia emersonii CBS 393.64]|uniref:Uncharacterized protein n=1 Tax=Rasamsonia emersonii (strain ATCC 16479 / CBS 393.64 / IMI 116815) TaxID=1408163 RepID=A0A0F4YNF4_RASE3|nr:hypothetical protein T310_6222 [Rasamsonia emersonii CBS 393.64]KKA19797.1 hypothetical protein T310_6222 [Rasamsonia emersonii CBS 393.64]